MKNVPLVGMAMGAFSTSFCIAFDLINVSAGQQFISGCLFLLVKFTFGRGR